MSAAPELEPVANCRNCTAAMSGPYCASCGQNDTPLNPPLQFFLRELAHELLNFDGKIFRSVRLLVTSPGFLTKEIFAGRRASYLSPIRLYLVLSVLAFALGAAIPPTLEVEDTSQGEAAGVRAELQLEQTTEAVNTALRAWVPRAMFLLVPLLAAFAMLVRRRSGLNYPQHLYFALHVLAFYFLLQSVLAGARSFGMPNVNSGAWTVVTSWFIVYFVLAFRTAYGTTILSALWRSAIVLMLYFFTVVVTLAAIVVPTMFAAWGDGAP